MKTTIFRKINAVLHQYGAKAAKAGLKKKAIFEIFSNRFGRAKWQAAKTATLTTHTSPNRRLLNSLLPPVEQAYLPNCEVRLLVKQTEFRALEPAFLPAREH